MSDTPGFSRVFERMIPEYDANAVMYRHQATGAQVLSISSADENKVFGVAFRTPPADSTGVAHILEHSVLCGSRRYPVKEPFVELLKGSLQTFLNAFTFPDKTCYPVASANTRDFYNLVDVYLDAVFFPLIPEHVFRQEGWHFETDEAGTLRRGGVVFNEMKGAYSSPDSVLAEYSQRLLFPDTAYGVDSGGDPKAIPNLTFEAFRDFHAAYYHPGNARIFFYGDDDPAKRLELLAPYLDAFPPRKTLSAVADQPPFPEPRRTRMPFASGEGDAGRGFVSVNWLLHGARDPGTVLLLEMLEHILIGMPSSPLRKALIDSGLGEDLAGGGLETELKQMTFSTGLKGIDPKDASRVEELVLATLGDIGEKGVPAEAVEAAVNSLEFSLRENNTGSFPRGLSLMLRALTTWLHDGDPLERVCFEAPLTAIKDRLARGERVFETLIEAMFLSNPHRVTLVLEPDQGLDAREEAAEAARLDALAREMGQAGLTRVAEEQARLRAIHETPDSPEALATIPRLGPADLPPDNKRIPTDHSALGDSRLFFHDLPTGGIVYLDLGLDIAGVPETLLPLMPLFGRALLETGTAREDFVSLTRRIARKTGGLSRDVFLTPIKDRPAAIEAGSLLFLHGKATCDKAHDLLEIMSDVLASARLDDRERLTQMALAAKARAERRLAPSGHAAASARLRARFGRAGWAAERMRGLENLFYLRRLCDRMRDDWAGVARDLERLRELVVTKNRAVVNVTLDQKRFEAFRPALADFMAGLPSRVVSPAIWQPGELPRHEGVVIPTQVNFVGLGVDLAKAGYAFHGSALVISRHLRMGYLWDRVRVRGGAYGAFCALDRLAGPMTFVSYRDPHTAKTLEVFQGAADYLKSVELSDDELKQAIVGAIGDLDAYMLPDAQGNAAMGRILAGDDEPGRDRMRREVFAATLDDFRRFGQVLERAMRDAHVVALGSRDALAGLAAALPGMVMTTAL
ncbi:insulinase family protein [Desulfolutivibrio sulfoxidireducens]|uniref:insulinase family protein n=1 Tax=Desulfolutivibrio sulfoxidireducens TaxID=2773299 RepID=UPI00159D3687|nr:insulinase family protein [Desulfolutivibrio sulfoxidireducens]QLA18663.1 peptidase M16 [Desulfolutivibrio sulfoxidireducens]